MQAHVVFWVDRGVAPDAGAWLRPVSGVGASCAADFADVWPTVHLMRADIVKLRPRLTAAVINIMFKLCSRSTLFAALLLPILLAGCLEFGAPPRVCAGARAPGQ